MLVQRSPASALRGRVTSYYGFSEDTGTPVRRREGPGADVVVVIALEEHWLIDDVRHTSFLAGLHEAQVTGAWPRLKGCRACGYAFFDRSKNRSAAWCAMSICGNRTKNRAYYRRRRAPAG